MSEPEHPFYERLRMLRAKHRLSQKDIAAIAGCAQSTAGTWERGPASPSVPELARLCKHFNVSADYMLGFVEHEHGLRPGHFIVDLDQAENPTPGRTWYAKIPSRPKIVDFDELKDMERRAERANRVRTRKRPDGGDANGSR